MIALSMSVTEGAVTRRIRVKAPTMDRAMKLAGYGKENITVTVMSAAPALTLLEDPEFTLHGNDRTSQDFQNPQEQALAA